MSNSIGVVKQVLGEVLVKSADGTIRTLSTGSEMYLGDEIISNPSGSKLVVTMPNGKDVVIAGAEDMVLDNDFLNKFSISNVSEGLSDLQKNILAGENLDNLEDTAAGRSSSNSEPSSSNTGNNEATSSTGAKFDHSGSMSNVFEGYGDLPTNGYDYIETNHALGQRASSGTIDTSKVVASAGNSNFEEAVVVPQLPQNHVVSNEGHVESGTLGDSTNGTGTNQSEVLNDPTGTNTDGTETNPDEQPNTGNGSSTPTLDEGSTIDTGNIGGQTGGDQGGQTDPSTTPNLGDIIGSDDNTVIPGTGNETGSGDDSADNGSQNPPSDGNDGGNPGGGWVDYDDLALDWE